MDMLPPDNYRRKMMLTPLNEDTEKLSDYKVATHVSMSAIPYSFIRGVGALARLGNWPG